MNISTEKIRKDKHCRICGSIEVVDVFELKPTPSGDQFIAESDLNQTVEKFPLILAICSSCGDLHLSYVLDSKESYADYVYETMFLN